MSVIAIKVTDNEIDISSDSVTIWGGTQRKTNTSKILEVNNMVIGYVGLSQEGVIFKIFCKTRRPKSASVDDVMDFAAAFYEHVKEKTDEKPSDTNEYFLIMDKKAFIISDWYIEEIKDYYTIGAGEAFALAALHLGHTTDKAVKAACDLSIYCEEPINTIKINKINA